MNRELNGSNIVCVREPEEFRFEHSQKQTFNRREIFVRVTGILIISLIFPFLSFRGDISTTGWIGVLLVSILRTTLLWLGSMHIINYLVSRYSVFREPVKLLASQVLSLVFFVVLVELIEIFTLTKLLGVPLSESEKSGIIIVSVLITFTISAVYASVSFFIQWKSNLLRAQALEKANMEARYDTLRNQVNPHFLFNSLNTLLMLVSDNPAASRYVESVSEFMRYMLNTRDKQVVLLHDELKMAREYVFIQENRFGSKLQVVFNVPESFDDYEVAPLALQMLIENALKHNVVSRDNPLNVRIFTERNEYIVVENNIQPKIEKEPSTGVGLENIRSRYLYLCGKEVIVNQENNHFRVKLPLFRKEL